MHLHIACNDPENGLFAEKAEQIQIGTLEFEATLPRPPRFREEPECIVLSGKRWPVTASKDWVGNWCWNAYTLSQPQSNLPAKTEIWSLVDFIQWLRSRNRFQLTCATDDFWSWWAEERNCSPAEVHQLIFDAIHEEAR